jgi:hypothetical protein
MKFDWWKDRLLDWILVKKRKIREQRRDEKMKNYRQRRRRRQRESDLELFGLLVLRKEMMRMRDVEESVSWIQ